MKRERAVTVPSTVAEPLPEIYVAADVPTLVLFPTDIQKRTLTVDESRIRVVDMGARSIIVQAAADYRADEHHELAVFFADGAAPARARFRLVMDPANVDTRIDVKRPEWVSAACPTEVQRTAPLLEDFVLMEYLGGKGVLADHMTSFKDSTQGLTMTMGTFYRGESWGLLDLRIESKPGRPPFTPREAKLTGQGGVTLRTRLVKGARSATEASNVERVLVVVDELPKKLAGNVALEVLGDAARRLVFPPVALPGTPKEGKR